VCADRVVEPPHCVGRNAELALVRGLAYDAVLGTGSALIWLGEPGIGKSRLLRECAAIKATATLLSIRCGASTTFEPNAVAQLSAALRLPNRNRKVRRTAVILSALAARLKHRPVAILVDDLHLADSGEASFVDALFAMAKRHRLVVVGCASPRPAAWVGANNEWQRSGADVRRLEPLDEPSMEVLVRGLPGAHGLARDDVREILNTAQGNPRFGIELVNCVVRLNGIGRVPASAEATIALLRKSLPRSDFEILSACSVIGDVFCSDWLMAITQRPRSVVADALQSATELGVLAEIPASPRWLEFRQIAVRKALYASIIELKRRILHERVVELLAAADLNAHPRIDVLLAHHAEMIDDHERAAASFTRAADRLCGDAVFAAAAEMYARAAAHLPQGDAGWLELHERAISCYLEVSDWKHIESMVRSLLSSLDRERDGAAMENALKRLFLAQLNDGDRTAAEQTATQIAALGLPNGENRWRSFKLILAQNFCYYGRIAEAARLLATIEPKHLANNEVRLRYLIARAEIGALVTPLERTLDLVDEAARVAQQMTIRGTVLCYGVGAEIASRYGDLATSREYIARAESFALKTAGEINDSRRDILKARLRAAFLEGNLLAVHELFGANVGWRASGRHNEAFDAGLAVTVGFRVGALALVDAFFDPQLLHDSAASRDAESCGWLLFGFGDVMQLRGMTRDLRGVLERCISDRLIDPYTSIQFAAARFAPVESAVLAVEQTEAYFGGAVAPAAEAHVALCKATLLRRRGQYIAAAELAGKAAARFHAIGWRLYEATALELAGNLRAAGQLYQQCGASSDVARLAAGETRKLKYASFGARLSPRELEVARLVAAHRSNRDIALALDISVRTVDHHVEAAFSKLGIRSRWQLSSAILEPRVYHRTKESLQSTWT
jgi:DNA-binding CsgD family transcriptional regulator